MQKYTLRGNSPARGIQVEGVRVISRGGARLCELIDKAERATYPSTTLFMFGLSGL